MKPQTKSFLKRRNNSSGELALQITSMADIFTILLIFLLKGYATDAATVQPSAGMSIPAATGSAVMKEALKMEVTESGISVEGVPVIQAANFAVSDSNQWSQLGAALAQSKKKQENIASKNTDVSVSSRITLIADGRAPWPLLKEALRVAAENGFTEPQLAVVKRGE